MKNLIKYAIIIAIVPLFIISGCKKTETTTNDKAFTMLKEYMVRHKLDLPDMLTGQVKTAPAAADVTTFVGTYYIMDLRAAADYTAGHIQGAVSTTLANVVTAAKTANPTKPILVVDEDGQTAPYAVIALRLSGFKTAAILKWGMSLWKVSLDKYTVKTGDVATQSPYSSNWTTSMPTPPTTYAYPVITTEKTDTAMILADQVDKMLKGGVQLAINTAVLTTPSNYYLVNYWSEALVTKHGIIKGAVRIDAIKIGTLNADNSITLGNLNNLDASKTVCTYCFTGQTSSFISAWLQVLGYNSKFIPYGTNGMIYSAMKAGTSPTANTWNIGSDMPKDLSLGAK